MLGLGIPELLVILVIALLIFGPKRLPEVGQNLGKALREFKKSTEEIKKEVETGIGLDEETRKDLKEALTVPNPVDDLKDALNPVETKKEEAKPAG